MTIEPGKGNLLKADVDALVNTVNTKGVMGKGLALQFKKAFPEGFKEYARACKNGEVEPGQMHIVQRLESPKFIINFPTKRDWRQPSRIEYIKDGLVDLLRQIRRLGIKSIAIPPLGCGNGGLRWSDVRPLIIAALEPLEDLRVVLYEPGGSPAPREIIDQRKPVSMTPARAVILAAMGKYLDTGYDYDLSLVELQKLAYFLQVVGEPLRLNYQKHYYGPYADDLRKMLRNMEGHFTEGFGDGKNSPETPIKLKPGALESAREFLKKAPDSSDRLDIVAELIEGFETPFGMELLGTVHWIVTREVKDGDLQQVIGRVHGWSDRKKRQMKDGHIQAAWERLKGQHWFVPA